jgi:hypothetical protein
MKFTKIGSIKINGSIWKYGYGNTGTTNGIKNDGLCSYHIKTIQINPQSTRSLEEVICHEFLHARFPDLTEEAVDSAGSILGKAINDFKNHLT